MQDELPDKVISLSDYRDKWLREAIAEEQDEDETLIFETSSKMDTYDKLVAIIDVDEWEKARRDAIDEMHWIERQVKKGADEIRHRERKDDVPW